MAVDAILNQLFESNESNQDIYGEDEISAEGKLIYSPHPLDEVLLSHQSIGIEKKMKAQCDHHEQCHHIQVHLTPVPLLLYSPPDVA